MQSKITQKINQGKITQNIMSYVKVIHRNITNGTVI